MQCNYIADQLVALRDKLRCYESAELQMAAMTLTAIAAEVRKSAVGAYTLTVEGKKPEPPRMDPNSKIPRPKTPPRGSGPVRLQLAQGLSIDV